MEERKRHELVALGSFAVGWFMFLLAIGWRGYAAVGGPGGAIMALSILQYWKRPDRRVPWWGIVLAFVAEAVLLTALVVGVLLLIRFGRQR
ncbi:MAG: hypothetical protein JSS29_11030 [Proteobacteria bacterium]|nr:hypothetical protein [Pseudomonadota bacterium]